jgi:two-component system probable response regulator PhcQ
MFPYDYKEYYILYVDDEEKALKYFKSTLEHRFKILTAINANEGYKIVKKYQQEIAIVVTDQRMPVENGVQFLEKVRILLPKTVRILVTAFSELDVAIQAVNTGAIYKYVSKPWNLPELEVMLMRGMEYFKIQKERDALLNEKISILNNMLMTDRLISLGFLATGLGHHLRNSMVAIKTFLDLTPLKLEQEVVSLDRIQNPDFWKNYYTRVQEQMNKITELLNQLVQISEKPKAYFPDKIKLEKMVKNALEKYQKEASKKNITVENYVTDIAQVLQVDQIKFERFLDLLLEDEIASVKEGGSITLRSFNSEKNSNEIILEIQDSGSGFLHQRTKWIFDPFYTRNQDPKNWGLNLMACFFIVHHHGGRVEISEASVKEGNIIQFIFPVCPPEIPKDEDQKLMNRILLNEELWEKLLTGHETAIEINS